MLDISDRSLSLAKMCIGAECIRMILLSIGSIPLMQQWMYVVHIKISNLSF